MFLAALAGNRFLVIEKGFCQKTSPQPYKVAESLDTVLAHGQNSASASPKSAGCRARVHSPPAFRECLPHWPMAAEAEKTVATGPGMTHTGTTSLCHAR